MKKLVLFFLILLLGMVFAVQCDTVIPTISTPLDGANITVGESFVFNAHLSGTSLLGNVNCETTLTFKYNPLGTFIRIPDPSSPSPNDINSDDDTEQTVTLIYTVGGGPEVTKGIEPDPTIFFQHPIIYFGTAIDVPIEVKCNEVGSYLLQLYAIQNDAPNYSTSSNLTVNCLPNLSPFGAFIKPSVPSAAYGTTYVIEWTATDPESLPLSYTVYSKKDAEDWVEEGTTTANYFAVSELDVPDETGETPHDYIFKVEINDGYNLPETITSDTLTVKGNLNTLSISDFTVTPEVIYGDGTIDVNLTLRNNSGNIVDINVIFFNDNFPGGDLEDRKTDIPAYSTEKFSVNNEFSNLPIGDYAVRILVTEYLAGTETQTNQFQSFINFTVIAPQKSVSLPETEVFVVILISLAVLIAVRKKR